MIEVLRQRLRTDDHAVRVQLPVHLIAGGGVVVASDVQIGKRNFCGLIGRGLGRGLFDDPAQMVHQQVEECAGRQIIHRLAAIFVFLTVLFFAVDPAALGGHAAEHQVDAQRHGLVRIECSCQNGKLPAHLLPLRDRQLGDLVANGIHHHAGVIMVFQHHSRQIPLPPCPEFLIGVVIGVFMHKPVVAKLVHHVHAQPVAGLQQRFGRGIVGAADCVEARFLQKPHSALFRRGEGARAQNAVVVVDARAAKQGLLPVDEKALPVPGQRAEAERILRFIHRFAILQQLDTAAIELRVLGVPQAWSRDMERHLRRTLYNRRSGLGCNGIAVADFYADFLSAADTDLHMDRVIVPGGDQQAIREDMTGVPGIQADIAIDPAAGVPAGVGNGGVVRDDGDLVFFPETKILIQRYIEIGVPIRPLRREASVQIHLRVFIDCLELQNMRPAALRFREKKTFGVLILTAGKIPAGSGSSGFSVPLLKKHGVMGQRDSFGFCAVALLFACPVIVKAGFLHEYALLYI